MAENTRIRPMAEPRQIKHHSGVISIVKKRVIALCVHLEPTPGANHESSVRQIALF